MEITKVFSFSTSMLNEDIEKLINDFKSKYVTKVFQTHVTSASDLIFYIIDYEGTKEINDFTESKFAKSNLSKKTQEEFNL